MSIARPASIRSDDSTSSTQMGRRWEELARADAMFYIATQPPPGGWTAAKFLASGEPFVAELIEWIARAAAASGAELSRNRALEIGCGLGRITVHMARHFAEVDAVDLSPSMIDQARELDPPGNVRFAVTSGADLRQFEDGTFDLVGSFLVFQHIPDENIVRGYLREIARVLRPGGLAALQFDTRRENLALRLYKSLPDILLPMTHRRYIRRYRRDAEALARQMAAAGLSIVAQRGPCGPDHLFLLRKSAP